MSGMFRKNSTNFTKETLQISIREIPTIFHQKLIMKIATFAEKNEFFEFHPFFLIAKHFDEMSLIF